MNDLCLSIKLYQTLLKGAVYEVVLVITKISIVICEAFDFSICRSLAFMETLMFL